MVRRLVLPALAIVVSFLVGPANSAANTQMRESHPPEGRGMQRGQYETRTYEDWKRFTDYLKGVLDSNERYWNDQLGHWDANKGKDDTNSAWYVIPQRRTYQSACGRAGDPGEFDDVDPTFVCTYEADGLPAGYLSEPWLAREILNSPDYGQKPVAVVLAHEFAHVVQYHLDIGRQDDLDPVRRGILTGKQYELQADCMAGTWTYAAWKDGYITDEDMKRIAAVFERLEDPYGNTHGTYEERLYWFRVGFDKGNPGDCDTRAA
jgi:predicted metalloprotease